MVLLVRGDERVNAEIAHEADKLRAAACGGRSHTGNRLDTRPLRLSPPSKRSRYMALSQLH
jgi:hypothetical protein